MPEVSELGSFPPPISPLHAPPPLNPAFLPNQHNGAPPSYSQTINPGQPMVQNVHVVINLQLGPYPASIQCPYCHYHIITKVTNKAGLLSWLLVCGLALIG